MARIGLNLEFVELNVRGSEKKLCKLIAKQKNDYDRQGEIILHSWEDFKSAYPSLKEILIELFETDSWHPLFSVDHDNVIFVHSVVGHEGLYDFDKSTPVEVSWPEVKIYWDNYNNTN